MLKDKIKHIKTSPLKKIKRVLINRETNHKNREKKTKHEIDESKSDGSASAFEGTEDIKE